MAEISREDSIYCLKATNWEVSCCDCELYNQDIDMCYIKANNKAISDMEKLEKIEQIIKKYDLQDITCDDVDNIVSGFEYEIIVAALGKDIEV